MEFVYNEANEKKTNIIFIKRETKSHQKIDTVSSFYDFKLVIKRKCSTNSVVWQEKWLKTETTMKISIKF